MSRFAWILLPILLVPRVAAAEKFECALSVKDLSKLLPEKAKEFKGRVVRKKHKHEFSERVRLNSGGQLTVTQGGCAHYATQYEFSGITDETSLTDRKYYLEKAAVLLETLPGRQGPLAPELAKYAREAVVNVAKANVADAANVIMLYGECTDSECESSYACGDATCGVSVKRKAKGKDKGKLVLSALYDFPI